MSQAKLEAQEFSEADRLAALKALQLLDSQPEAIFESLTQLAAATFGAPVALVTLIDAERQWFKSCLGLELSETTREAAFCDHTIRSPDVMVILDAHEDPRFRSNPLVTGAPGIRFYAGAPIAAPNGARLGSLCVIDFSPRTAFSADQRSRLKDIASCASAAIALRQQATAVIEVERKLHAAHEALRLNEAQLRFLNDHSADLILRLDPNSTITWASESARAFGWRPEELEGRTAADLMHPDDLPRFLDRAPGRFASISDDLAGGRREFRVRRKDGGHVWVEENPKVIRDSEGRAVELLNVLRDITDRRRAEAAAGAIQAGMLLPRSSLVDLDPRIDVDAVLAPARQVGGDLYDCFRLDDDRLAFLVGDVTGKGQAAALFMALAKALARVLISREPDLGAALGALASELQAHNGEAMSLSLLAGVLDLRSGALSLCNAGLDHPILRHASGEVVDLLSEGRPPLCVADDLPFDIETRVIAPGEMLVVVTDGVTDAEDAGGAAFGRARLKTAISEAKTTTGALDALLRAVRLFEHGREPTDDLAALALRRR